MAARPGHFRARAKRVIWIFTNGGPSQVDTWEYKPALERWHGKSMREFDPSFQNTTGFFKNQVGSLMKSPFRFTPRGGSGKMVSEIFPNLGRHVDKMAFLHSVFTESNNHSPALFMINTGMARMGFPCMGSWVTYGLGSEAENLPGFVVMSDPKGRGLPKGHAANWGARLSCRAYTRGRTSIPRDRRSTISMRPARNDRRRTASRNWRFLARRTRFMHDRFAAEAELAARIQSYELAYRMQSAAPEAIDIDAEPRSVQQLYGIGDPRCDHFARQCLTARRLVERGVRFVQIYSGGMENERLLGRPRRHQGQPRTVCRRDRPTGRRPAGRPRPARPARRDARDLGRRVRPASRRPDRPEARPRPQSARVHRLARRRRSQRRRQPRRDRRDRLRGRRLDPFHINDLHATILHLLGIDHERLTYTYNGRRFRLTDVAGKVVKNVLA